MDNENSTLMRLAVRVGLMTHLLASLRGGCMRVCILGQNRMTAHKRGPGGEGKDGDRWGWWQPRRERNAYNTHVQSCCGQLSERQLYKVFLPHPCDFCTKFLVTK